MKILLPLILFFAFALNSCEEKDCCLPETDPINDVLDFNELLSLMGGDMDQIRDKIPGELFKIVPDQEVTALFYQMIPANASMNDTLLGQYIFSKDTLRDIWMIASNEEDPLNLTKQMISGTIEKLGEGEYSLLWNGEIDIGHKHFTTAKELWNFIEVNDINSTEIRSTSGKWRVDKYVVTLAFTSPNYQRFTAWINGPPIIYEMQDFLSPLSVPDSSDLQIPE